MAAETKKAKPQKSWPYFKWHELVSKDTKTHKMDDEFMEKLVALRKYLGFPLVITSAYRTKAYNKKVKGSKNSAHILGRAVDIQISGQKAFRLVRAAPDFGFKGIGIGQRLEWDHKDRYIHLDDMTLNEEYPRPTIWSY